MKSMSLYPDDYSARLYRTIGFLLLLLAPVWVTGQTFTLKSEQPVVGMFIGEDSFGHQYTIDRGVLLKTDLTGQHFTYSNRQYGNIFSVDITDPLNLLVFFRDFGVVVLLDNKLAEKKIYPPHLLHENDVASAAAHSSREGFWVYFPNVFRLSRYSNPPGVISQDLSLNPGIGADVLFLKENNDRVFLMANHLMIFDVHANFLFSLQHIRTPLLQLKENKIFYLKDDQLCIYDFFLKKEDVFLLPESGIRNFFVKDESTIYLQIENTLRDYHFSGEFY